MRLILALLAASICWSQPTVSSTTPVVVGWPASFMRFNDNTNASSFFFGDTLYTTILQNGNRYFSCNDCWWNTSSIFTNALMNKMTGYSNSVPNTNTWAQASDNTLRTAFLFSTTSSQNCSGGCTLRTRGLWTAAGKSCWNLVLEDGGGAPQSSSIICSANLNATPQLWANPAHIGSPVANGDMPNWAAADSSVMFIPSLGVANKFGHIIPIIPADWQDDGTHCPIIPVSAGGDGAGTYLYFYSDDTLNLYGPHRVACTDNWQDPSKWQTRTSGSWTSTLTSPTLITVLCWCTAGLYGAFLPGTSPQVTFLPVLGAIAMTGQIYQWTYDTSGGNVYYPSTQLSTSTSIFGPFVPPAESSQLPILLYQNGTNPRTRKLNGAINSSVTTVIMTVPYTLGLEPPILPFDITVDSEDMRVTAAAINSTSWTVVRGVNGTSAASHLDQAEVKAPIRNMMQLNSFVPGTYSSANGVESLDMIFDIGQSDGTTNDSTKANAVYSPGIGRVTFQLAPQQKTTVRGNTPFRFQKGRLGKLAIDPTHIVGFMDFNEHGGNQYYGKIALGSLNQINLLAPGDLVGTMACTPAADMGGGAKVHWGAQGIQFDGGDHPHCTTNANTPITGGAERTVTVAFQASSISNSPIMYEQVTGSNNTQFDGFVTSAGAWWNCFDTGCMGTADGLISAGNWYVITSTYRGGATNANFSISINGVPNCGYLNGVTCTVNNIGANVLNTSASPINIGGTTPYDQPLVGQMASLIFHDVALIVPEITEFYAALKAAYSRRGISLP